MRFRIADLLVATAVVALGCAAVLSGDGRLPAIFLQVTAATLGYAALQVAYSRLTRPFWLGYLTFGAARLATLAAYSSENSEPELLTWLGISVIRLPMVTADIRIALSCFATLLIATLGGVVALLVARTYHRTHEKTGPSSFA